MRLNFNPGFIDLKYYKRSLSIWIFLNHGLLYCFLEREA
jgi:hypothetical protein